MRNLLKYFKPFDYIIIILAIALSFIPPIITNARFDNANPEQLTVGIVKIRGEVIDEFVLEEGGENFTKAYYPNDGQYNIIEVDGDQIRIKEDNSPDQIGVNTGWISLPGQVAICLPHGLIVEVAGNVTSDELILPL